MLSSPNLKKKGINSHFFQIQILVKLQKEVTFEPISNIKPFFTLRRD